MPATALQKPASEPEWFARYCAHIDNELAVRTPSDGHGWLRAQRTIAICRYERFALAAARGQNIPDSWGTASDFLLAIAEIEKRIANAR